MRAPFAIAALLLALVPAPAAHAKPAGWVRAQTSHFVLYAQADRDSVLRLARNLESMAAMLEREGLGVRAPQRAPVVMLAIADRREFEASLPVRGGKRAALSGLAHTTPFGTWIGFAAYDERGRMVAHHELLHTIVDASLGRAPLWMNEGLAEYFSTWRTTPLGGHYGDRIPWHVWVVRNEPPLTLDEMFAVTTETPAYAQGGERMARFYAESWALTHYLLRVDGRTQPFREMALAIADGVPARRAFGESFPGERWEQVPNRLADYVEGGRFASWDMALDPPPGAIDVAVREATAAEVDAHVGMWRAHGRGLDDRATRALLERSAAAPGDPALALAALGALDQREHRAADARRHLRAAAAVPDASPLALSAAGGGLLVEAVAGGARDTALAGEAFGVLQRSVARDPADAVALGWYGRAALASNRLTPAAMRALEEAATALPTDGPVASAWAAALSHTGQAARAREVLAKHEGLAQNRELGQFTGAALAFDAFRDSSAALARDGRYDELERLLDRTERTSADDRTLAAVRSLRTQLADARAQQRFVDRYNAGVRALNARELEKARDAFAAVRDSAGDAKLREQATKRVAELAGMLEFERGRKAFDRKDWAEAAAAFERARDLAITDELRATATKNAEIARKAAAAPAKR